MKKYIFIKRLIPVVLAVIPVLAISTEAQERAPEWSRGFTWYMLVPDRFMNGDTADDNCQVDTARICDRIPLSEWRASGNERVPESDDVSGRRYGGDLQGVIQRLDYISDLGIHGLILTPVFASPSIDKYDPSSHHHIDPALGPCDTSWATVTMCESPADPSTWRWTRADSMFLRFVSEAHAHGMRVVLEVQWAYVNASHWAVQRARHAGASMDDRRWFTTVVDQSDSTDRPWQYMWKVDSWPKLNSDSLHPSFAARRYMTAVTRRWMDPNGDGNPSDGIDGWKVLLSGCYSTAFWKAWMDTVKSINPSALVLCDDAPFPGRSTAAATSAADSLPFDAVMPAVFRNALLRCIADGQGRPTYLDKTISDLAGDLDGSSIDAQVNIIGSNLFPRAASLCRDPEGPAVDDGTAGPGVGECLPLLLLMQWTLPGSPMLYYGDEVAVEGRTISENRPPMPWAEIDKYSGHGDANLERSAARSAAKGTLEMIQLLTGLRERHLALRVGSMNRLAMDDEARVYAYARDAGADKVYIVINWGREAQECKLHLPGHPDGMTLTDPIHNLSFQLQKEYLSMVVPPRFGLILVPAM
jgi:glycosidase